MNRTKSNTEKARASMRAWKDLAPQMQQFALALSILMQRIAELPHRHRDALFALLQQLRAHGNDLDERDRIHYAMEEIITSAPSEVTVIDVINHKPGSDERSKLAKFIGRKIRNMREGKNWTQDDLAKRAALRQSHVCRLENGDHTPTRHTIEKIAKALGVAARVFDPIED